MELTKTARINGYIKAVADSQHPFQTKLSLILTDFSPNGNRQGIPKTEAERIIKYALNQPLKINFTGEGYLGHTGAFPIGPIISAYEGIDNGRDVIFGDAIIWNTLYEDIKDHLIETFANGIGTSWEIYFEEATQDEFGNEWLHGCVFDATCIVETPAYGPNRTRVLAIAEKMRSDSNEVLMGKEQESAQSATDIEEIRNELSDLQDLMFNIWEGVDNLFASTFDIEAATVEKDVGKIAETFAEKLSKLADKVADLKKKAGLAEQLEHEVATLKEEKSQNERAELIKDRVQKLSAAGLDTQTVQEKLQSYIAMSEDVFDMFIHDLQTVRKLPAQAEQKERVIIPEPMSKNNDYTIQELAKALRNEVT